MFSKHKYYILIAVFLIAITALFGCGKNQVTPDTTTTTIPDNNPTPDSGTNPYKYSIEGNVYMPASFVTSLSIKTQGTSSSSFPWVGAVIKLKDSLDPSLDITKIMTGQDSFRTDANGKFILPVIVTGSAAIIEITHGPYKFVRPISPFTSSITENVSTTINHLTTAVDCTALQTGYDSLMNIALPNAGNDYKTEFISNIINLKNNINLKSEAINPDIFKSDSTSDLITNVAEANTANIEVNTQIINIVKNNIIPTAKNIFTTYQSIIPESTYPRYTTQPLKYFGQNVNDEQPFSIKMPKNSSKENVILKFVQTNTLSGFYFATSPVENYVDVNTHLLFYNGTPPYTIYFYLDPSGLLESTVSGVNSNDVDFSEAYYDSPPDLQGIYIKASDSANPNQEYGYYYITLASGHGNLYTGGSKTFKVNSATDLFPSGGGSGYFQWNPHYAGGCHEFYLWDHVSGNKALGHFHIDASGASDTITYYDYNQLLSGSDLREFLQREPYYRTIEIRIYAYKDGSIEADPSGLLGIWASGFPIDIGDYSGSSYYSGGSTYYSGSGSGRGSGSGSSYPPGLFLSGFSPIDYGNSFYWYSNRSNEYHYLYAYNNPDRSGSPLAYQTLYGGPSYTQETYSGLISSGLDGHSGVYLFLYHSGLGWSSGYYSPIVADVPISGLVYGAFLSGGNYYCPKGDVFSVVSYSSQNPKKFTLFNSAGVQVQGDGVYHAWTNYGYFFTDSLSAGTYYARVTPYGFNNWYAQQSVNVYNPFISSGYNYLHKATYQGMNTRGVAVYLSDYGYVNPSGSYIYATHYTGNKVIKFDFNGNYIGYWGSFGTGAGQFNGPAGVAVDSSGYVYVVDQGNQRVQKFDSSGTYIDTIIGGTNLSSPEGIAIDSNRNIFVADYSNGSDGYVKKFDSNGNHLSTIWSAYPRGVAVDSNGYIYVTKSFSPYAIYKYNSSGSLISSIALTDQPWAIAVDQGNNIYVTILATNSTVRKYYPSDDGYGYYDIWGGGQLIEPKGLAVNPNIGYVYIGATDQITKIKPMP